MTIHRDISLLNPKFALVVRRLNEYLVDAYETGRTKSLRSLRDFPRSHPASGPPQKGASKAGPFQSAHQFGLAVDFVPILTNLEALTLGKRIGERVLPGWSWHSSHDYSFCWTRRANISWRCQSLRGTKAMWNTPIFKVENSV